MKNYLIITLGLLSILLNNNIFGQSQKNKTTIVPVEFSAKLKACPSCILMDIRTPEEFKVSHLQNAINIDWYGTDFEKLIDKLDKSKPVFIYCKSGGRSSAAASKMVEMGFNIVIELSGGITNWQSNGLPVTK